MARAPTRGRALSAYSIAINFQADLYPRVSHAPLNRRAIRCFRNAIQLHHIGPHSNPQMRRDILQVSAVKPGKQSRGSTTTSSATGRFRAAYRIRISLNTRALGALSESFVHSVGFAVSGSA